MSVQLDLDKYSHLQKMVADRPQEFKDLLQKTMSLLNRAEGKGWVDSSYKNFHYTFSSVVEAVVEALYDFDGLARQHHNPTEKEVLKIVGYLNNPLAVLGGNATPREVNGEAITLNEFSGQSDLDLKKWFQQLFYSARYLSHKDLIKYLLLGDFDLVEMERAGHIRELIRIQPALRFQKDHDIPIGTRINRTSFFLVGEGSLSDNRCPACDGELKARIDQKYKYCETCRGGIKIL